ncbi:hypothetical protein SLE2022_035660 [Rubroshorea leprosula]
MKRPSWVCTLATQVCLCFALYMVLNLGQPQESVYRHGSWKSRDFYFISVRGGFRPIKEQNHLLKLMEKVVKTYNASFVVNISELGEDDPLMHNVTLLFPALKVSWYSTRASSQGTGCFLEKIVLPNGKTLDIVNLDTGLLQDIKIKGLSSGTQNNTLNWLARTLEATDGNWLIVIGFHPLLPCEENNEQMEAKQIYEPLHHIFMKYGVNVYISRQGCNCYALQDGVTYIGTPSLPEEEPHLAHTKGRSIFSKEMANGFLLHRVSMIEIVTYFVTSAGEVVYRIEVQQRGKEVM